MGFVFREVSGFFARRRRWRAGVRGWWVVCEWWIGVCVSDSGGGDCGRGEVAGDDPVRGVNRVVVVYDRRD